ncbi:hypothetical protein EMPS_01963 [Entomortierella parvispora]|uniref:CHY-type domain-containing protein n=1 Tax=Entomortierella parvispora TaxID=205924 RepID=A0A9P3H3W8_9FUNG|nr:hypothetical protein EMPS_01963 [Entomortierella parvispora]
MSSNSNSPCQFFTTKKGCRNGASCPFLHINMPGPAAPTTPKNNRKPRSSTAPKTSTVTPASEPTASSSSPAPALATASTPRRAPPASRAPVRKPVPKSLQNLAADQAQARAQLRQFEISQVQSRFASSIKGISGVSSESSVSANNDQNTVFELKIVPSDPDFPYEIDALHVRLVVPLNYPEAPPSLTVLNSTIPKGFSTNLERGFDAAARQHKSLLQHLNWLDVNMEQLLQKPPAPTIRFVGNANNANGTTTASGSNGSNVSTNSKNSPALPPALPTPASPPTAEKIPANPPIPATPPKPTTPVAQKPAFTSVQLEQASLQRQQQMAQIQARFRSSIQTISPTEIQIALESANKSQMPVIWEGPLWINFLIPKIYPLEPCEIRLKEDGHNPELELWRARNVEAGFRKFVAAMPQHSLFQLLNQLNRDLKDLMSLPKPEAPISVVTEALSSLILESSPSSSESPQSESTKSTEAQSKLPPSSSTRILENDKNSKLIYVDAVQSSRPRNFEHAEDQGVMTSEDDEDDYSDDSDEESDDESNNSDEEQDGSEEESASKTQATTETSSSAPPKRGIEIRMPDLKLEHISLLYCRSLNLLVRCNRCKGLFEIPDLVPQEGGGITGGSGAANKGDTRKWKTCENCQSLLGAHFRTEYIHIQSRTLGYIDLAGCTAFDLLPSAFVPTCEDCDQVLGAADQHSDANAVTSSSSTHQAAPVGFRQRVGRGMSATANCRKCHVRMTLTLEGEIKFVKLSPGDLMKASAETLEQLPLKKKLLRNHAKNGGLDFELKVGEPLPRKGACDHYKKSRRWFRFPCCSKIYPCHLCHDEKEADHESEFAKRMVCGHCSREQTVSDKPCVCGESPVKSTHGSGAFWEGGEGMRDKTRMSNKDSKKFKGANKTVAKKQVGAENARKRAQRSKAD